MLRSTGWLILAATVAALLCAAPAPAQPVPFTGNYTQNFDTMGQVGTTPPAGWQVYQIAGSSSTWNVPAGIPNGTAVAGGTPSTGLTPQPIDDLNPASSNVNGYNATTFTPGPVTDRAIATAPTGIAGNVIELQLVNNSGAARSALTVAYDIRRFQMGSGGNNDELPGFWLFYSLDNGATYTNVPALNPVLSGSPPQIVVPNSNGVTTVPPTTFSLSGPWNAGSNLFLRWVDDNGIAPSPDQIVGLDNLTLTPSAVPEPSSLLCLSAVALLAGARAVRRRRGARPVPAAI